MRVTSDTRSYALALIGPPSPPSKLDPLETKSPTVGEIATIDSYVPVTFEYEPPSQLEIDFRHSGWTAQRERIFASLQRTGQKAARIESFWACGKSLWVEERDDHQDCRTRCDACHDRLCRPCANARALFIRDNLNKHVNGRPVRFLTLTLRHSYTALPAQYDRLYRSFLVFRRRKDFRQHVKGGCAFPELKVGRDGLWHLHLHCIVEGTWWSNRDISTAWHEVTGDSSIVDIRQIRDTGEVIAYVTKYLTKPFDNSIYTDPVRLDEVVTAIRGRRLIHTFGSWRGVRLTPKAPEKETHSWTPIASWNTLHRKAAEGDPDALRWITAIQRKLHPTDDAGQPHDAAP